MGKIGTLLTVFLVCGGTLGAAEGSVATANLNAYVLEVISTYEIGNYPYLWTDDYTGVTRDLVYQGEIIARAHPEIEGAAYCVGLTFEVFFQAMQRRNKEAGLSPQDFKGLTFEDLVDFRSIWYVAQDLPLDQCHMAAALKRYGLGEQIYDFEQVLPGDFVQIWRTGGSGHATIFIGWIREADEIVGLEYWSTQPSTNGLNYNTEYFSDNPPGAPQGTVLREKTYIGRAGSIKDYKPQPRD